MILEDRGVIVKEKIDSRAGEGTSDLLRARVKFMDSLIEATIAKREGGQFPEWLYSNEGEVSVVQLILPKELVDVLEEVERYSKSKEHWEQCKSCPTLEECKQSGLYDNPVRVVLTEIFKLGFSEVATIQRKRRSPLDVFA